VRPGTVLDEQDELVFNALVGNFYGEAYKLLAASQGDPDAAFRVRADATTKEWVQPISRAWDEWRTKSLEKLEASQFVVLARESGTEKADDRESGTDGVTPVASVRSYSVCPFNAY
jgi:hypothetical protein